MVFCYVHSHIRIQSIVHFMPVCDVHLYSTGHIVQNMSSLMWTQNVYINFAHAGFQNVEIKVKQFQSQCTSLQPYWHIHHDIAACCVKGTSKNWWQHSHCRVISHCRFLQINAELLISTSDVCLKWSSRLIIMNWEHYFIIVFW